MYTHTTDGGDPTRNNYDCQNFQQVLMVVHMSHTFLRVFKFSNRFSMSERSPLHSKDLTIKSPVLSHFQLKRRDLPSGVLHRGNFNAIISFSFKKMMSVLLVFFRKTECVEKKDPNLSRGASWRLQGLNSCISLMIRSWVPHEKN